MDMEILNSRPELTGDGNFSTAAEQDGTGMIPDRDLAAEPGEPLRIGASETSCCVCYDGKSNLPIVALLVRPRDQGGWCSIPSHTGLKS
jgi:hypothetical protein